MACLYWRGRVNLWEGDRVYCGSAYCDKEIWTYLSAVFPFSAWLVGLLLTLHQLWGSSNIAVSQFILQTWQKTHPGEKDNCILLDSRVISAQLMPSKSRGSAEERIWFRCNLMLTYFVILWIVELQLYHSKTQNSHLQIKRCFPRLLG